MRTRTLLGTSLATLAAAAPAPAATLTVNSDNDTGDGVCAAHCSLRDALTAANGAGGADEIVFSGALTITPTVPLPPATDTVTINGSDAPGCAGSPRLLALDGDAAGFAGLVLTTGADGSRICQLNVRGFTNGINVQGIDDAVIEDSRIGTTLNGEAIDANSNAGINVLDKADRTRIEGNLISGNTFNGIQIAGVANGTTITGNLIGTDKDGEAAVSNGDGIHAVNTGGTTTVTGNTIAGNGGDGIQVTDAVVTGNRVGTDATGLSAIQNGNGIHVNGGHATVGGATAAERNIVSGNDGEGVFFFDASGTIRGNWIGPAADGSALADQENAVYLQNSTATVTGNVLTAEGSGVATEDTVTNPVIDGNLVGLLPDGVTAPGGDTGISFVNDVTGARVTGNTIAGQGGSGIDSGAPGAVIEGNVIGLDTAGNAKPNTDEGINLKSTADGTRVGGTGAAARNVIGANGANGVEIESGADGVVVQGNWVGLGRDGAALRPNGRRGVSVLSADDVEVSGNTIAGNAWDGIEVSAGSASLLGNLLYGNGVFSIATLGIDLGADGRTPNDPGDADAGASGLQNFPVVSSARANSARTEVAGTIDTTPGRTIRIELFSSAACDARGSAELFLGATTVTAGAGATAFSATLPATAAGRHVTATATDLTAGETSELSDCRAVEAMAEDPAPATTTTTTTQQQPPPPPPPAAAAPLPPPLAAPVPPKFPAKLRVLRNGVDDGVLDMLVEITSRAAAPGAVLQIDYESSGRHTKFTVPITGTQVKVRKTLPSTQPKDTGITTVTYAGNAAVGPDEARLRAADGKSLLTRKTATVVNGLLTVDGTVSEAARGVVRIRLGYDRPDGTTAFLDFNAPIDDGTWRLSRALPAEAARGGQLSIQFTGYEKAGLRGEQTAKAVP